MIVSVIVAVSENNVIGVDGKLPWHLSADLKRFKQLTMGHTIVMGRLTYESINRLLPGRRTVILTRRLDYEVEGAEVVHDWSSALDVARGDDEIFVVGGAAVYEAALPVADRIYLTRVCATIDGDASFPTIDWTQWRRIEQTTVPADERNEFPHVFEIHERRHQNTD